MINIIIQKKYIKYIVCMIFLSLMVSSAYSIELSTTPSGYDVWDNQTYLGKTPIEIEPKYDSHIYLFNDQPIDRFYSYQLYRLDRSLFVASKDVHIDKPYCSGLSANDCKNERVPVSLAVHGFYPMIFLLDSIVHMYSYDTSPSLHELNFFIFLSDDNDVDLSRIENVIISPDAKYLTFFNNLEPYGVNQREWYLYSVHGVDSETNQPILERIQTKRPIDHYQPGGEYALFSPDSRWFMFCVQDIDQFCHFKLLDMSEPEGAFTAVGEEEVFNECVWQHNETSIACRMGRDISIFEVTAIDGNQTGVVLIKKFSFSDFYSDAELVYSPFYFVGKKLVVDRLNRFDENDMTENVLIYSVETGELEKEFQNARLAILNEDGSFVGVELLSGSIPAEIRMDGFYVNEYTKTFLDEVNTAGGTIRYYIYNIYKTETKELVAKVIRDDAYSRIDLGLAYRKAYYMDNSAFFSFLLNSKSDIITPRTLFDYISPKKYSELVEDGVTGRIDIIDDTVRVVGGYEINRRKWDGVNISHILSEYGYGEKEQTHLTTIYKIPEVNLP